MRNKIFRHGLAWVCLSLMAAAPALRAYVPRKDEGGELVSKWQSSPVVMQVKLSATANLIDGGSQRSSVLAGMQAWNAQLGTLQFVGQASAPGDHTIGNQVNEIVMASAVDGEAFPAGVLAVTFAYGGGNDYVEADIVFNSAYTWNSYRGGVRSGVEDIQRVAIHELGHALGLDHPDEAGQSVTAIMNSQRSAIDRLQGDDIAGGQYLYGAPGVRPGNDAFANAAAIMLNGDEVQLTGSNIGATRENGESGHAGATSVHSVWWKWTASGNGAVTVDTRGSNFDTVLAVYTGAGVSVLTEIASNDDEESLEDNPTPQRKRTSKVVFNATGGVTYRIAVDGWGDAEHVPGGYTGSIVLNVSSIPLIAPAFTSQPVSQTVSAGTYVAFTVEVSGSPAPGLQWQRRPVGGAWMNLTDADGFAGTATSYLSVGTTVAMDGDQYRCIATNGAGAITSDVATLTVTPIPLPVITTQPRSSVFQPDERGELVVIAKEATGYQWHRNGVPLEGQIGEVFYVVDPKADDAGEYHVVVTNPGGSVQSATVTVTVAVVPEVTNLGALRQVVAVGQPASFSVSATGTGELSYQWYHEGRPITGATSATYSRVMTSWGDNGAYWVAVSDDRGTRHGAPFFVQLARGATNVVNWGAETTPSSLSDAVFFGGSDAVCLIKQDGTLETRGVYVRSDLTDVVAVAARGHFSAALKADGTVTGSGGLMPSDGEDVPAGLKRVVAVSCGLRFALALKTNGTVVSWGRSPLPTRDLKGIVAISAGYFFALALKSDGKVVRIDYPEAIVASDSVVPAGLKDVVAIAAGVDHALALKADGTLVGWGDNEHGKARAPAGLKQVVAISAGMQHSLALKADGTVVAWGRNYEGEGTVPSGLSSVFAIAAGHDRSFALRDVVSGRSTLVVRQPVSQTSPPGYGVYLNVDAAAYPTPHYEWRRNGTPVAGATNSHVWLTASAADSGLYDAMVTSGDGRTRSEPAIVGITIEQKVVGDGVALEPANILHPNGNTFDQVLLTGPAEAITADHTLNQITRTSFVDLDDDIVQVELSGPGTLTLVLDEAKAPARPVNYHQDIDYVKGHAGIVIAGADERTNVSVFTVGRATAFDPTGGYDLTKAIGPANDPARNGSSLFEGHAVTNYDGVADIAFIAIVSADGKFGGVRTANANFFAEKGYTGLYAPGVSFQGPVFVGDVTAFDDATPVIRLGEASDVRITGGDLFQDNGAAVEVSGITKLKFTSGSDSHGRTLPAQANRAVLKENGVDVTAKVAAGP